jgi:hypothetical protein
MEAIDPYFTASMDIPNGGALLALPALLANGLMRYTDKYFQLPKGYYGLSTIFLLVAFMLLARIKSIEGLRYCAPGEWGKLLGLDRIPEVKTFREKVSHLSHQGKVGEWSAEICQDWMNEHPEHAASLYIDGHVRVYHGKQANIPKHYVARQKLCLRATCDYWVNAVDGTPFFVVPKDVDPGLLNVLENEIVPRALREVPCQLTEEELQKDPLLHRFILIFDREGYSPDFMLRMKKLRIACMTYNKFPKEDWGEEEFRLVKVQLVSGEVVDMKLAERGTLLNQLWVRETRRLTASGHQTSIISTTYRLELGVLAMGMFARWSQENFFKYMRQNYSLDRLIEYTVEEIPDNIKVVNPKYRNLDGEVRKKVGKLNRKTALFGSMTIDGEIDPKKVENYQKRKAELQEEIILAQKEIEALKDERKKTKKHVLVSELPDEERLQRLSSKSKDFLDTIKMICYRAETAMVKVAREVLSRADDARSFIRSLYETEVDILPDEENGILKIRLHCLTTRSANEVAQHLCDILNETKTTFPGTKLKILYEMVSS